MYKINNRAYKIPIAEVLIRAELSKNNPDAVSNCVGTSLYIVGAIDEDIVFRSTDMDGLNRLITEVEVECKTFCPVFDWEFSHAVA